MPMASVRNEESGKTVVSLRIGADGAVKEVKVVRSSGFAKLDEAAREGAMTCRFMPRKLDGVAIEGWEQLQYRWWVE